MNSPNRVTVEEIADGLLLRMGKLLDTGLKARLMLLAKDLYKEMNMSGIKDTKRIIIDVKKNSNIIQLPSDNFMFSSISVLKNGKFTPLLVNQNISQDIIDLSFDKKCDCGCSLCASVKNYEIVQKQVSAEMPDGSFQVFTKTSRKKLNKDGSYYLVVSQPMPKYEDGVHVSTTMITEEELICKLEVVEDEDGQCHVCDTKENEKLVFRNCVYDTIANDCGRPFAISECDPLALGYNLSDSGDQIILPSKLSYDKVMVRYYADLPTKKILVPFVAKKYFIAKLYHEVIEYDREVPQYDKNASSLRIKETKVQMLLDLSRLTLSETYAAISPKRIL